MPPNSPWHVRSRDEGESVVPVRDAVADFLADASVKSLRPKTQDEYTHVLHVFADWCGEHALTQDRAKKTWKTVKADDAHGPILLHAVNDQAVHCFLNHVKETHKPSRNDAIAISSSTLADYAKVILRFLNWCLLDEQYSEHVKAIVVARIKKPKIDESILETFTPEQLEALFKACDKEYSDHLQMRDRAILSLLVDSGIRASELVTLTISHVSLDPKDPYIRVYGKGGKWGECGMGEKARRAIQKYIRQFREPTVEYALREQMKKLPERAARELRKQSLASARLFVNRAGQPLTRGGLLQLVVRLGEWADISGVRCSPHTFRHTFAKLFMQNGGDIYRLSKLLRHSSVKVTENYLKSLRQSEARRGAASVLDNL